jgi:phage terminase large subunit
MIKEIQSEFNELYEPVFSTDARYIDIWGGRARGGSHFATDYFLFLITAPGYFRGCFMRAVLSDVRGSLWQDFKDRMEAAVEAGYLVESDFEFNETMMSVTYAPTGNSIISKGFKKSSGSQSAKLKSLAGMTHVAIEECEEVGEDDFNKLDDSLRTVKVQNIQVLRIFNPPSKNHWLMKRFYNLTPSGVEGWYRAIPKNVDGFLSIHSTYLDNIDNLHPSTIKKYQQYGDPSSHLYNRDFFYRDVKGLVSEGKKGRILTKVFPISFEEFKALPFPSFFGLDFGYSTDPVALIEMKFHNGRLYAHQRIYKPGHTDDQLADEMELIGISKKAVIVADSSEPKSIAYLKKRGFNVRAAVKGADSINNGIKQLQSYQILITDTSEDLWLEVEEYAWALDSEKNLTDSPIDEYNHGIDAMRYGASSQAGKGGALVVAGVSRSDERDPYDMLDDL